METQIDNRMKDTDPELKKKHFDGNQKAMEDPRITIKNKKSTHGKNYAQCLRSIKLHETNREKK